MKTSTALKTPLQKQKNNAPNPADAARERVRAALRDYEARQGRPARRGRGRRREGTR